MAAKTSRHRYVTKLRHCHRMCERALTVPSGGDVQCAILTVCSFRSVRTAWMTNVFPSTVIRQSAPSRAPTPTRAASAADRWAWDDSVAAAAVAPVRLIVATSRSWSSLAASSFIVIVEPWTHTHRRRRRRRATFDRHAISQSPGWPSSRDQTDPHVRFLPVPAV